jgi:putative flippase GtrA
VRHVSKFAAEGKGASPGLAGRIEALYALAPPFARTQAFRQLLRYAFAGFGVTLFSALVYMIAAYPFHIRPLVANVISYAFGLAASYTAHSRWSFAADREGGELGAMMRFGVAAGFAFCLNSFWVWLATYYYHLAPWVPVPAMVFATPLASFLINRYWVFRVA